MKTKKQIVLRVLAGLGGLWLGFFLVFSAWHLAVTREELLQKIADYVNQTNESINDEYRMLWLSRERVGLSAAATPQTELKACITQTLTHLRNGLEEVEFAYYNETGHLMGQSGDYLVLECPVPSEIEGLSVRPSFYMIMDLREALSPEAAEELMAFFPTEPSGLCPYTLLSLGFWTDGQYMVPKKLAIYEAQVEEDGSIRREWEVDEAGNKVRLKNGTLRWSWENQPEPQAIEGMTYIDGTTTGLDHWPMNLVGESHTDLQALVLDEELAQRDGGTLAADDGYVETDADVWLVAQGGVLCTEFYCISRDDYDLYLMDEYQPSELYTRQNNIFNESTLVAAGRIYPLKSRAGTLAAVGLGSLALCLLVGAILVWQLFRVYDRQMELEDRRRSTTNAMAHDLKTPMAAILGYGDNLLEQTHPEKQALYVEKICTQVRRMDEIVADMLELSRLEAAVDELNLETFPLEDLCREAVEATMPEGLVVSVTGTGIIRGDRALLRRVVENFLTNGVKFTPAGSRMEITITPGKCTVFNQGPNIPESALPHLWEAHYQRDQSRSQGGSGLGLSIAREILTRHGFSWGAENREDGVAFWFEAP